MKLKRIKMIAIVLCSIFMLIPTNIYAEEEWQDEYTNTNGKEDFYVENPKARKVYPGYARNGEFFLFDGQGNKYIASRVRGAYSGGTVNLYYVPQLGRELDDREYDVYEIFSYQTPLTMSLKRNCTVYTQPFLSNKYKTSKVAVKGEYKVTKRSIYWAQVTLKDGTVGWVVPQYSDQNQYYATNYASYKEARGTLSVSNIGGINVYQKMMSVHENQRTGIAQAPQYVTIHNTANTARGANALSHANYQVNNTSRVASWHYTVDQSSIYQSMPMNEVGWHAGDGALAGNGSSVAIEICENSDGNYAKAERNAALLTARILYENNLPSDAVRLHRDWSGKNCAQNIIEGTKGTMGWNTFKKVVAQEYTEIVKREGNVSDSPESLGPKPANSTYLTYQSHVQNIGWEGWKSEGQTSGTTGKKLRLEAMSISLNKQPVSGSIQYQTHIQDIGWQGWKADGKISGTSGLAKRLEAIKIRLTGEMEKQYDVYYRVHAQNIGWLDWAKNGATSGTMGYGYRLEAIEIKLTKKGAAAPGKTNNTYKQVLVNYQTHIETYGWQGAVSDGAVSGTSGQSKRLEGISIALQNQQYGGSLEYRTHVQNIGWQGWKSQGSISGTSGRSLRLEAIEIRMNGEMATKYDIYYRTHCQKYGWLGWAKNGSPSGTTGKGLRLEAIQIQLVPKGGKAPGSTSKSYI